MRRVLLGLVASASLLVVPAPAIAQLPIASCGSASAIDTPTSGDHFDVYGSSSSGPTVQQYADVLDEAYQRQVTELGWWAPPPPSMASRYTVVIDGSPQPADGGEANAVGSDRDNPNSPWAETDATSSCLHLTDAFADENALRATAAREFNRMILIGIGALEPAVDPALTASSLALMEQITFPGNPAALGNLWPDFADSLGAYDDADQRSAVARAARADRALRRVR